jgi:hypothetical protein
MRQILTALTVFIAIGFCTLFLIPAPVQAQVDPAECVAFPQGQEAYECFCPPMSEAYGSVWGSGPYTADSDVCMAALHYGTIGQDGGNVVAYAFAGMDSYEASFANGVQSSSWGAYGSSFMFESYDAPLDEQPIKTGGAVRACAGFPDAADILTCTCTPQATAKGTFWGNDPYTIDSDICIAARHSGIIDASGGTVTAIRVIGLDDYTSTLNNGVESEPSGPFGASMVFDRN